MNWDTIQNFSSNIVFGILLFSMIIYWVSLSFFKETNNLAQIGRSCSTIANILLFFILASRWIVAGYFPLSNLYESLLFLTWTLLTIYLYLENKTKSKLIGAVLIPVALLITAFANLTLSPDMQKASPLVPALQSNWLMMHVSMMMLSYATLIMGSLLCILFLVISKYQDVDLQIVDDSSLPLYNVMLDYYEAKLFTPSDEISELGKLKLLQSLDNWSYRIIGLGFPFLTIGIIAGGVWANESWGRYWGWDSKETWALVITVVYTIILHFRLAPKLKGEFIFNVASIFGFGSVLMTFIGVNYYFTKGMHSYGGGETPMFPMWAWIAILAVVALIVAAGLKKRSIDKHDVYQVEDK